VRPPTLLGVLPLQRQLPRCTMARTHSQAGPEGKLGSARAAHTASRQADTRIPAGPRAEVKTRVQMSHARALSFVSGRCSRALLMCVANGLGSPLSPARVVHTRLPCASLCL